MFSGFNEADHKYDNASWGYQLDPEDQQTAQGRQSLDDPKCVMAKLKEHYKRYTFKVGSEISGIPEETIKLIADTMIKNRPGTIMYALGMTQHTVGVQNIRCFGVLQLLLGQHGETGRRRERHARRAQCPGLHRHGPPLQLPAGISCLPQPRPADHQ